MAHRDIRDHLAALESKGKLRRIRKNVDHTWEVACLARWMFQALPDSERFGLLFERVKGHDIPVMTGVLGASRETYAIALETEATTFALLPLASFASGEGVIIGAELATVVIGGLISSTFLTLVVVPVVYTVVHDTVPRLGQSLGAAIGVAERPDPRMS